MITRPCDCPHCGEDWADGMEQAARVVRAEAAQTTPRSLEEVAKTLQGLADYYPGRHPSQSVSESCAGAIGEPPCGDTSMSGTTSDSSGGASSSGKPEPGPSGPEVDKLCGIPANGGMIGYAGCDMPWGHEGNIHGNAGDGYYSRNHDEEHLRRQKSVSLAAVIEAVAPAGESCLVCGSHHGPDDGDPSCVVSKALALEAKPIEP